jgi:hypothetical protein
MALRPAHWPADAGNGLPPELLVLAGLQQAPAAPAEDVVTTR